jgi:hypothetical protein
MNSRILENSIVVVVFESEGKVKGKAMSLQAWRDPEGSRRLRLQDFKTIGTRRW